MKSLKILTFIFLVINFHSIGQYKKFNIGLGYSTNNFSNNYNAFGLSAQYNLKNTFSICSGINYEKTTFNFSYDFTTMPPMRKITSVYNPLYISVPLLLKASIGNKILFFINAGLNYSMSLKSLSNTTVHYYEPHDVIYEDFSTESYVFIGKSNDLHGIYGFGITAPIHKNLIITLDTRGMFYFDKNKVQPTDGLDLYLYRGFYGAKFSLSLAYQFNLSKKSDFKFSPYKITLN